MTINRASARAVRRILAIDGGGVRGIVAIEVLLRLEEALAKVTQQPGTRLADYFHLIAGTSAGAIIATAVAMAIPMREVRDFVILNTNAMFLPTSWVNRLRYQYDKSQLEQNLKDWFGAETTLESERLKTLLLLVMRNASTDSPWLVSSNPRAPFNQRDLDDCNLDLKLWQLARASAAAPGYFEPETVRLGRRKPYTFVFVDGALTGFNNPAFKAFLYATTEPYGINWPATEKGLLVLSVGTGMTRQLKPTIDPARARLWNLPLEAIRALIYSGEREQDLLCRTFGRCLMGETIDLEVGDLHLSRTAVEPKLFTYFRINPSLTRAGLDSLDCGRIDPRTIEIMDSIKYLADISQIGQAVADRAITPELLLRLVEGDIGSEQ